MNRRKLKQHYPLLHKAKLLRKTAQPAVDTMQLWGTMKDQEDFRKIVSPGLFLELLDYWLSNDGKKFDWRN